MATLLEQLDFTAALNDRLARYTVTDDPDGRNVKFQATLYTTADERAVIEVLCLKLESVDQPLYRPVEVGSALEAAVIPVIEQMMEHSTFVEAEKEDAPRLQSGHGGGILRIEDKSTIQIIITDPARWAVEHAADAASGIRGCFWFPPEEGEPSVVGVFFPPEPNLEPLPADLRFRKLRQLARWPKGHTGAGAIWADLAWARMLCGDPLEEIIKEAIASADGKRRSVWPCDAMPPGGAAGTYAYLMRRFGPPKMGFDSYKEMGCWYLSAGGDVIVSISPKADSVGVGICLPRVFQGGGNRGPDPWWRPQPWIVRRVVAIMDDLMRPTYVRDVYFNPRGRVKDADVRRSVGYFDPFEAEERAERKASARKTP